METEQTTYSIKQAAELTGLSAPTLRYYESVGICPAIAQDESSGHRIYRRDYLALKIRYLQAVEAGDKEQAGHLAHEAISLAQQFR